MAFLNETGLAHLWAQIVARIESSGLTAEEKASLATKDYVEGSINSAIDDAIGGSY